MFFLLLLVAGLSSIYVSYLHMNVNSNKLYIHFTWTLITITSIALCCYLFHSQLVFINGSLSNVSLFDTLTDSNYLIDFIQNLLLLLAITGIYYFLRIKLKIKPFWFLITLLCASLLIYYSGTSAADTQYSYNQYLAHNYQLWQPPFFTIWWHIFHIERSAFLVGTTLYYSSLIYISYTLEQEGKKWQNDLLVLLSLNPLMFTQIVFDVKDVSFVGMLLSTVALYIYIYRTSNIHLRLVAWIFYYICLFFAVGFRVNGIVTTIPLICLSIYEILPINTRFRFSISIILSLLVAGLFYMGINTLNKKVFRASDPHFQVQTMITDLAYIECNTHHQIQMKSFYFKQPDQIVANHLKMCDYLNYYNADFLYPGFKSWQEPAIIAQYPQVKQDWFNAITSYPLTYLSYRARFFINDLFYQFWDPSSTSTNLQRQLNHLAMFQHFTVKFLISIFLVLGTLVCLFLCLYFKIYNLTFALILSSLLQLLIYFFLIPANPIRYFFWNYLCVILSLALLTINFKKQSREKK